MTTSQNQMQTFLSIVIMLAVGAINLSTAFQSGHILIPPKLRARPRAEVLVPPTLASRWWHSGSTLRSIVKRSTQPSLKQAPHTAAGPGNDANRLDDGAQHVSSSAHKAIVVPPTVSTGAGNSNQASTDSSARVVCYADRPIEYDIPCPTDTNRTALTAQHISAVFKNLGGTIIKDTMSASKPADVPNHEPEVDTENLKQLFFTISSSLHLQQSSMFKSETSVDIETETQEVIELTGGLFQFLNSTYGKDATISLLTDDNKTKTSTIFGDLGDVDQASLLTADNTSANFSTKVSNLVETVTHIHNFYSRLFQTNRRRSDLEAVISELHTSVDFDASKEDYSDIDSAISRFESLLSVIKTNLVNNSHSPLLRKNVTDGDFPSEDQNSLRLLFNSHIHRFLVHKNIRAKTTLSAFSVNWSQTDQEREFKAKPLAVRVIIVLESKTRALAMKLRECSLTLDECQKNLKKLEEHQLPNTRKRRDVIGTNSQTCQAQGERIDNGNFLSLCSSCVQTTSLSEDYFPRYITEKVCQGSSSSGSQTGSANKQGCLFQPGGSSFAGGRCLDQSFHINILKRVPGRCMKITLDDKEVVTDLWRLTAYPLRGMEGDGAMPPGGCDALDPAQPMKENS